MQQVAFTLVEAAPVQLTVFDVVGRRVAVLVDGHRPPGSHLVSWEAAGQPSGVYFYRLITPDRVVTARTVLLR